MIDLKQQAAGFSELRAMIEAEPGLAPFRDAAVYIEAQAHALADGARDLPIWPGPMDSKIPSADLADRIVQTLARLPPIEGDEDEALHYALARLHGNVACGIFYAIWEHPEVVAKLRSKE